MRGLAGGTADKPENVMMKTVIDITLMTYGVRLRDDRVSAMIADKIKAGSAALSLLMTKNHLEKIGTFNLNMTPKKMESLLSKQLPSMFSEKKSERRAVIRVAAPLQILGRRG